MSQQQKKNPQKIKQATKFGIHKKMEKFENFSLNFKVVHVRSQLKVGFNENFLFKFPEGIKNWKN